MNPLSLRRLFPRDEVVDVDPKDYYLVECAVAAGFVEVVRLANAASRLTPAGREALGFPARVIAGVLAPGDIHLAHDGGRVADIDLDKEDPSRVVITYDGGRRVSRARFVYVEVYRG